MPCDHENPTLFGAERVICGTYKDESGRFCHAPLKCQVTGDGEYTLCTDSPYATQTVHHSRGLRTIAGKPGVCYHVISVMHSLSFTEAYDPPVYTGLMALYGKIGSYEVCISDASVDPLLTSYHGAVSDSPNLLLSPGGSLVLYAYAGYMTVRYREVVVQ